MFSRIVPVKLNARKQPSSQYVSTCIDEAPDQSSESESDGQVYQASLGCLQCRVLRKHADRLAQLFQPELRNVDAVDANGARIQLNNSEQQVLRRQPHDTNGTGS